MHIQNFSEKSNQMFCEERIVFNKFSIPQGHMKLVLMRFLTVMLFVYKTPLNNVFLSLIRIHFMSFRGPEDQTEFIPTDKVHNTQACGVS